MIVSLVRTALALQILLVFALAAKTTFSSRMLALDVEAHHKLFLMVFVFLAFLAFNPRYINILTSSVKNNLKYILLLAVVGVISLELIIRIMYPGIYPTYSYLMENKRYVIDGKESLFTGLFKRGITLLLKEKGIWMSMSLISDTHLA